MRPDFTLLTPGARRVLGWLAGIALVRAVALVVFAQALSVGITEAVRGGPWQGQVPWALGAAALRAAGTWATTTLAARTAADVKAEYRGKLMQQARRGGAGTQGSLTLLATTGLNALDNYFVQYFPALVSAAAVPPVVGLWILYNDWLSAGIIVLTVGLIPAFMILIGLHTQDSTSRALRQLENLSHQLVELVRGLPVLVGLGRSRDQSESLRDVAQRYRTTTMGVLRISFMSSLALELIATISVAIVAVVIGIRLVYDVIPLDVGLVVLILAPECYLPLREIGAGHHASEEGVATLRRIQGILRDGQDPDEERGPGSEAASGDAVMRVEGLTVTHSGGRPLGPVDFELPGPGIHLLRGPSGAGKSTLLHHLAGVPLPEGTRVRGELVLPPPHLVRWVPQHPHFSERTVGEEIRLYLGDPAVAQTLALVGLEGHLQTPPGALSPGEQRRLAFIRAVGDLLTTTRRHVLLLDEPTAHLDRESAERVRELMVRLSDHHALLLVSHDPRTAALARHIIPLAGDAGEVLPAAHAEAGAGSSTSPAASSPPMPASGRVRDTGPAPGQRSAAPDTSELAPKGPAVPTWRVVASAMGMGSRTYVASVLLGIFAACAAVALTSVSGWLIVRASEHPPIMYLTVAIVAVRFFGIGRAAGRYFERITLHEAIFTALTRIRVALWERFSAAGLASRALLDPARAVDIVVEKADQLRDTFPRVVNPLIAGMAASVLSVAVLGWVEPSAVWVLAGTVAVGAVALPALSSILEGRRTRQQLALRSEIVEVVSRTLGARGDLTVNGAYGRATERIDALDGRLRRSQERFALGQGALQAAAVLTGTVGSVLLLDVSAARIGEGMVPAVAAALALTPLALIDVFIGMSSAAALLPALRSVARSLAAFLGSAQDVAAPQGEPDTRTDPRDVRALELAGASAAWGDGEEWHVAFERVDLALERGSTRRWVNVVGPSGSGKTTLMAVLLGFLPLRRGSYSLTTGGGGTAPVTRREQLEGLVAWCPQEGHIFDSTLRGNLLLARPADRRPTEREMLDVLAQVGLDRPLEQGLDTPVGSEGSRFSGGERQRIAVARALLTGAPVVLLDEPTAHLDREAATRLLGDLRSALADRMVVMVTHHHDDLEPGEPVVALPARVFT